MIFTATHDGDDITHVFTAGKEVVSHNILVTVIPCNIRCSFEKQPLIILTSLHRGELFK